MAVVVGAGGLVNAGPAAVTVVASPMVEAMAGRLAVRVGLAAVGASEGVEGRAAGLGVSGRLAAAVEPSGRLARR